MEDTHKIKWLAPEYEEKIQSNDWFWALGIIIFAIVVTSIIIGNYFFAVLILIGGFMLGYLNQKKPKIIEHEIQKEGIRLGNYILEFKNIKSFWIHKEEKNPSIFIRTHKIFTPMLKIPIEARHYEAIRNYMSSKEIKEEEITEHFTDKIMEFFGF